MGLFAGALAASPLHAEPKAEVHLVAVGDVAFRRHVGVGIVRGNLDPFVDVREVLGGADVTFCNLETVLSDRSVPDPVNARKYPILKSPPRGAEVLAEIGFDVVSVANNHAFDLYAPGMKDTLTYLDRAKVAHVGGGLRSDQAEAAHIHESNGLRLGFLAFASGMNRAAHGNAYLARPWGRSALRAVKALLSQVDVVLVSIHWGTEDASAPNPNQVELAHALIDAGADVILGHHPHVLQSVEVYHDRPVIYSMGNFLFGKQPEVRRQTAILHLRLGKGPQPVRGVALQPVFSDEKNELPHLATGEMAETIRTRLRKVSKRFRTTWTEQDEQLHLVGKWSTPEATAAQSTPAAKPGG